MAESSNTIGNTEAAERTPSPRPAKLGKLPLTFWGATTRLTKQSIVAVALLLCILVSLDDLALASRSQASLQTESIPAPRPGNVGDRPEPVSSRPLYDFADIWDDVQESDIDFNLRRLLNLGLPTVVVAQAQEMDAGQTAAYASELRSEWRVESREGADDGLLILIVVDPGGRNATRSALSWGENALPNNGLDQRIAQGIEDSWLSENLEEGRTFEGVLFTLRRFNYYSEYEPPQPGPLSERQALVRTGMAWASPALALVAIAPFVMTRTGTRAGGPWNPATNGRLGVWIPALAGAAMAPIAVWSQSEIGVFTAIILLVVSVLGWALDDPAYAGARRRDNMEEGIPS
jgi:uncharacterized membrane protein YgcG